MSLESVRGGLAYSGAGAGKLDPFKDYIRERVEANAPNRLPATVVFREIQALGYRGGERIVRSFVSGLYPVETEDTVVRFETEPGEQLQIDWCELRGHSAFVATPGYSRKFVDNERFDQLRQCLVNAYESFGGVPKQLLFDNMKTVVETRDYYAPGKHKLHPGLWSLAKEYSFRPALCRPYRAQTKGKVERFNRYLRNSFYYPLVSRLRQADLTLDRETANVEVKKWLRDVANVRVHDTTGESPLARLQATELATLQALPRTTVEVSKPPTQTTWPVTALQRKPAEYDRVLTS